MYKYHLLTISFLFCCVKSIAQQDTIHVKGHPFFLPDKRIESRGELFPLHTGGTLVRERQLLPDDSQHKNRMPFQAHVSTFTNKSYAPFVLPVAFVSYGVMARFSGTVRKLDKDTHEEISEHITRRYRIDDFTQFVPAVSVYGLELLGVKPKHSFRDRTFVMVTSHLFMGTTVMSLKAATRVERPDAADRKSFPSGHTATAFTGAQVLFREYREASPWIAAGGYAAAGLTGAMRIVNRKHWVSDVITGAGIGILSVEVAYLLLPVFQKITGGYSGGKSLVVVPTIDNSQYGAALAYTF